MTSLVALAAGLSTATTAPAQGRLPSAELTVASPHPPAASFAAQLLRDPAFLGTLRVSRQYELEALRQAPRLALQGATADFTPLFRDPRSLVQRAARLRAQAQDVEVTTQAARVVEIAEGILVDQTLGYRIRPGRCADPAGRAALEAAGARCFVRRSPQESIAAFSRPGDLRYVTDPTQRARAVAEYSARTGAAQAMVDQRVRALRGLLAAPETREAYLRVLGPAEVQRIASSTDEQIADLILDTAEVTLQQTLFVPRSRATRLPPGVQALRLVSPVLQAATEQLVTQEADGSPARDVPSGAAGTIAKVKDWPQQVYLTGFTIGQEFGWAVQVGFTIDWCLISAAAGPLVGAIHALSSLPCKSSHWILPQASFGYGFGLRFPMAAQVRYEGRLHPDKSADARVSVGFAPVEGNPQVYAAAGLSPGQFFDGKELVAQLTASAGLHFDLPAVGTGGVTVPVELDLTRWLPAPFTDGQFLPPKPGSPLLGQPIVFDQLDLLLERANLGFAGARIMPALQWGLVSNGLGLTLTDQLSGADTRLERDGQTVALRVHPDGRRSSRFSIGKPTYNLAAQFTPGLQAHLFIELALYSKEWDLPIWFPELSVQLPPDGVTFSCHPRTVCTRSFQVDLNPTRASDSIEAKPRRLLPSLR